MDPISEAIRMFRYREEATRRALPFDPDWGKVVREAYKPALAGERGETDQQQCAYQAIRLEEWPRTMKPWTKAFLPQGPVAPISTLPWYRRWWGNVVACGRAFLKYFHDRI